MPIPAEMGTPASSKTKKEPNRHNVACTTIRRRLPSYVYYNCGNNKRTHQCSPHSFSEAKLTEIVFHAIHDQIEVVLHLDKVLRFIDSLPQRDRKVFSYEAQMTRLEDEIQRYKKLELGLYENFVEGIINKAEYTDFRENYRGLIEEKQEAVKRLKREQQDAAAMGSQNRAWVQVFAQYENVQELDRRLLLALVDRFLLHDKADAGGGLEKTCWPPLASVKNFVLYQHKETCPVWGATTWRWGAIPR